MVIPWILSLAQYTHKSTEIKFVFNALLSISTFQTIILVLLLGARLDFIDEYLPFEIGSFFPGKFRDFTQDWFLKIGVIYIIKMLS